MLAGTPVFRLFAVFRQAGRELFLVGGAVRDLLRGIPLRDLTDLDFATDATPDESLRLLKDARQSTFDVGRRFGTIGTLLRGATEEGYPKDCQITTYRRRERYSEGSRHPVVQFGRTLEDDLWRRDFSINSMAMTEDAALIDPYGGRADLEAGVLRSVGDPLETLRDDPLRLLRIARFVSKLGFEPDSALRQAAEDRAETLLTISRERWLQEMDKLLLGPHVEAALRFLQSCRVLGLILPEVAALDGFHLTSPAPHKDLFKHTIEVVGRCPVDPVLRWTALLHDTGKVWTRRVGEGDQVHFLRHEEQSALLFEGVAARFRMDRDRAQAVETLIRLHTHAVSYSADWSDTAVRRLVERAGVLLPQLLLFAGADLTTQISERREAVTARLDHLRQRLADLERSEALRPRLPAHLGGYLIETLGLDPGPQVGELVDRVREAALAGELPAAPSEAECVEFLRACGALEAPTTDD